MKLKDGWYAKDSNQDVFGTLRCRIKEKDRWVQRSTSTIITLYPDRRPMGGLTPQGRGRKDHKSTDV